MYVNNTQCHTIMMKANTGEDLWRTSSGFKQYPRYFTPKYCNIQSNGVPAIVRRKTSDACASNSIEPVRFKAYTLDKNIMRNSVREMPFSFGAVSKMFYQDRRPSENEFSKVMEFKNLKQVLKGLRTSNLGLRCEVDFEISKSQLCSTATKNSTVSLALPLSLILNSLEKTMLEVSLSTP